MACDVVVMLDLRVDFLGLVFVFVWGVFWVFPWCVGFWTGLWVVSAFCVPFVYLSEFGFSWVF